MSTETRGRSSEALEALKARRAAASVGMRPPPPAPRPAPKRRRHLGRAAWIAAVGLLVWGIAATYLAVDRHLETRRLREEAIAQKSANEERVRALTRRLVGVASHQVLEQDGLTERLADIITRQVEIENRQAVLNLLADRLVKGSGDTAPTRGGALEPPGGATTATRFAAGLKGRPLADQFARIEASLRSAQSRQVSILSTFGIAARHKVETVRAALAGLGIRAAPDPKTPVRPLLEPGQVTAASLPADAFRAEVGRLQANFAEGERWTALADALPLKPPMPIEGNTTSNFGVRHDPFTGAAKMHAGMDFRSPVGTPTRAAGSGRVISAGDRGGYGNLVEIDHGFDLTTRYAHLSAINVTVGQTVSAGTVIGLVGSTGRSTGPHLHYETRLAGAAIDPARFMGAGAQLRAQAAPVAPASPTATVEAAEDAPDE